MNGHTPGPWQLRHHPESFHYEGKWRILFNDGETGRDIAEVHEFGPDDLAEAEANARLLAAAPDLLAAAGGLAWLGNNLHNYGTVKFREFLEAAILDGRAAIAKAEGRS